MFFNVCAHDGRVSVSLYMEPGTVLIPLDADEAERLAGKLVEVTAEIRRRAAEEKMREAIELCDYRNLYSHPELGALYDF